jgi:hypothetical protein
VCNCDRDGKKEMEKRVKKILLVRRAKKSKVVWFDTCLKRMVVNDCTISFVSE